MELNKIYNMDARDLICTLMGIKKSKGGGLNIV